MIALTACGWMLLWTVAAVALSTVLRPRIGHAKWKLFNICAFYFWLLPFFGQVYWIVYNLYPADFVFASEILLTRKADTVLSKKQDLAVVNAELSAVDELTDQLSHGRSSLRVASTSKSFVNFSTAGYSFEFFFSDAWFNANGRLARQARLVIRDKAGNGVGIEPIQLNGPDPNIQAHMTSKAWDDIMQPYFPPREPIQYREMLAPVSAKLDASASKIKDEINQVNALQGAAAWGPIDFLYFSVITQTTVGYGDILPNSSLVRILVMIQVLSGLLLIGVTISWVASDVNPALSKKQQGRPV